MSCCLLSMTEWWFATETKTSYWRSSVYEADLCRMECQLTDVGLSRTYQLKTEDLLAQLKPDRWPDSPSADRSVA